MRTAADECHAVSAEAGAEDIGGSVFDIAGGLLTLYESGHGCRFLYDGGAGGMTLGVWRTVEDCRAWIAANADALA